MSKQPASALGYKTVIKVINAIRFLYSIMLLRWQSTVTASKKAFTQIIFKSWKVLIVVQVNNSKFTFNSSTKIRSSH